LEGEDTVMEMTELHDGNIKSIGYDEMTRELHVRFENGDYLIYYEVFKIDYVGIFTSDNMSKYFEERIQTRYPFKTINNA